MATNAITEEAAQLGTSNQNLVAEEAQRLASTTTPEEDRAQAAARESAVSSTASRGLRQGFSQVGSMLNNAVGQTGLTLGLSEFAQDRFDDAAEYTARADEIGLPVRDLSSVRSFGDLVQYVTGQVTRGLATSAPILATAAITKRPIAGVFGGSTVLETGEQVGTLRADPRARAKLTDAELLAHATGKGVVGGALELGGAPGQVARRVARGVGKGVGMRQALKEAPGAIGRGMAGEAVTEAAQTLAGQVGHKIVVPEAKIDPTEILESAAAGAAGGIGVSLAGQAAQAGLAGLREAATPQELRGRIQATRVPLGENDLPAGVDRLDDAEAIADRLEEGDIQTDQILREAVGRPENAEFADYETSPEKRAAFIGKLRKDHFGPKFKKDVEQVSKAVDALKEKGAKLSDQRTATDEGVHKVMMKFIPTEFSANAEPADLLTLSQSIRQMIQEPAAFRNSATVSTLKRVLGPKYQEFLTEAIGQVYGSREGKRMAQQAIEAATGEVEELSSARKRRIDNIVRNNLQPRYLADTNLKDVIDQELAPQIMNYIEAEGELSEDFVAGMQEAFGENTEKVLDQLDALRRMPSKQLLEQEHVGAPFADDPRVGAAYQTYGDAVTALEGLRKDFGPHEASFRLVSEGEGKTRSHTIVAEDPDQLTLSDSEFKEAREPKEFGDTEPEFGVFKIKGKGGHDYMMNAVRLTRLIMRKDRQQTREGGTTKYVSDMFSRAVSALMSHPNFKGLDVPFFPDNLLVAQVKGKRITYGMIRTAEYGQAEKAQELRAAIRKEVEGTPERKRALRNLGKYYQNERAAERLAQMHVNDALEDLANGVTVEEAVEPMQDALERIKTSIGERTPEYRRMKRGIEYVENQAGFQAEREAEQGEIEEFGTTAQPQDKPGVRKIEEETGRPVGEGTAKKTTPGRADTEDEILDKLVEKAGLAKEEELPAPRETPAPPIGKPEAPRGEELGLIAKRERIEEIMDKLVKEAGFTEKDKTEFKKAVRQQQDESFLEDLAKKLNEKAKEQAGILLKKGAEVATKGLDSLFDVLEKRLSKGPMINRLVRENQAAIIAELRQLTPSKYQDIYDEWKKRYNIPGEVIVLMPDAVDKLLDFQSASKASLPGRAAVHATILEGALYLAENDDAGAIHGSLTDTFSMVIFPRRSVTEGPLQLAQYLAHEFGHALEHQGVVLRVPLELRKKLISRFLAWREKEHRSPEKGGFGVAFRHPSYFARLMHLGYSPEQIEAGAKEAANHHWYLMFSEWFAEQSSKFILKDRASLTPLERVFHDFGKMMQSMLRATLETMQKWFPKNEAIRKALEFDASKPDPYFQSFMEGYLSGDFSKFEGMKEPLTAEQQKEWDITIQRSIDQGGVSQYVKTGMALNKQLSEMDLGTQRVSPELEKQVRDYVARVLGTKKTKVIFEKLKSAGEFADLNGTETLKISVDAIDPRGVGYHEALHALFQRLIKADPKAARVLTNAANSAPVVARLRQLLANHPKALKQLDNAEERVAYMYQFWASGEKGLLQIGPETQTFFSRVRTFFKKAAAVWFEDADFETSMQASEILNAFHNGAFADRNDVAAVMQQHVPTAAREGVAKLWPGLGTFFDRALWTAAGAIRDYEIPAMTEVIDKMHTGIATEGKEPGFLQSKHVVYNQMLNRVAKVIEGMPEAGQKLVWQELIDKNPRSEAAKEIRKVLDDAYIYLNQSGVKTIVREDGKVKRDANGKPTYKDLQKVEGYIPRVFAAEYVRDHRQEFIDLLMRHNRSKSSAEAIYHNIVEDINMLENAQGDESLDLTFYAPFTNERTLGDIPDTELAPFMESNLFGIMSQYLARAARRGEYTRRFGNSGELILEAREKALEQGADVRQLAVFDDAVRAMEGTLGADMTPQLRAVFGSITTYQNIRLLPLALFSSLVDAAGIKVRGGTWGEATSSFFRGLKELFTTDKDHKYDIARAVGAINIAGDVQVVSDMYSSQFMSPGLKKLNELFFKYNGMESWNRSMRTSASAAAANFLQRHAFEPTENSERYLRELNIKRSDINNDANGSLILNDKVKTAINTWVDQAILRPNAALRPIYMSDPNWILVSHLKQYTYLFQQVILNRVYNELKQGNYDPAFGLMSYLPVIIMSDMARAILTPGSGDDHEDWEFEDYLWRGVQRAGFFGPGQMVLDSGADLRYGGALSLLGPSGEQLMDFVGAAMSGSGIGEEMARGIPGGRFFL